MEYIDHIIILIIDGAIFGYCYLQYSKNKHLYKKFSEALDEGINPSPNSVLGKDNKLAIVYGKIKAVEHPIKSVNSCLITGVIQKLTVKERDITRSAHGYWTERFNLLDEKFNIVPFTLNNGWYKVNIKEPLSSEYLSLDIIEDRFEPSLTNFIERIFGYLIGLHHQGLQYTEYLLKENSNLTGFGILTYENGELVLQPPVNGTLYVLTPLYPTLFLHQLKETIRFYRWPLIISGCFGVVVIAFMIQKWCVARKLAKNRLKLEEMRYNAQLENLRRQNNNDGNQFSNVTSNCIICYENEREIVLLPCRHLCICEECAQQIDDYCPVCRQYVQLTEKIYMS